MQRILFPLLASLALPTAVNAESYWLVMSAASMKSASLEKIEMASMEQCEENGEKFKTMKAYAPHKHYICIKGK